MTDFPHLNVIQSWQQSIGQIIAWEMAHHKQTVFMITTNIGQKFVFKNIIHMPNLARLTSEYNVLHYLHKHGVPVSVPLLTDDGAFYTQVDGEIFMLSPALSTTDSGAESTDRQKYYIIGKALGQFHRVLATYPGNIDSWTMNLPHKLEHEILPILNRI